MNDTSAVMNDRFVKMLMQLSGEERLKMGCSMFDTAKEIVKSSITQKDPQVSLQDMKGRVFLRFYGDQFDEVQLQKMS